MAITISWDNSQFDPNRTDYSTYLPSEGEYDLQIVNVLGKTNDKVGFFVEIEFLAKGDNQTFSLAYMVNHPNAQTSQIAQDTLARIYFAVFGVVAPVNYDIEKVKDGKIKAEVKHNHKDGKIFGALRNIRAYEGAATTQAQPAPAQANTYGKPSW